MRVIYVSYDGALDPLGASQVVPYLLGLAEGGVSVTLVSFEKPANWMRVQMRDTLRERLEGHGIRWRPLRYHKRPRLAGTLRDIIAGCRVITREASRFGCTLVHCRGDIATIMARWAHLPSGVRFLYDVRGFFSDERVESGSWRRGGIVDRVVRCMETRNLERADGAVVLTRRAAEELRRRRPELSALGVVPTCADVSVFRPRATSEKPEFGLVYSGSLGTWYMAEEMVAFARSVAGTMAGRTLFLTPQPEVLGGLKSAPDWAELRSVAPGHVAGWLRRATALFFFIRPIPSKRASCPTKFGEALASGLPVICNRGIGDLDDIVEREGVGVLVDGFSQLDYASAAGRLRRLLQDPDLSARCRRLAESRYSVDLGVSAYRKLYGEIVTDAGSACAAEDRSG